MEKEALIERLQTNKAKSKRFNFFGQDCHKELDDRISILKKDLSPDQAEEIYGFDCLDVFDVLHGDMDVEDILYPEL